MYWTANLEGGPKRVNHAAGRVGHHIYSFGGYNRHIDYDTDSPISVYVLNTVTLRWTEVEVKERFHNRPFQRYGHTVVEYGTDIILWGGRNDRRACNVTYIFDTLTRRWKIPKVTGSLPHPRDGHSACVINDRMYIFGGFLDDVNVFCRKVYYLDLKTYHWTRVTTTGSRPEGRDFHSASAVGSKMYIIGGRGHTVRGSDQEDIFFSSEERYWSSIYYLDTKTNIWHQCDIKGKAPLGRRSLSTFVKNGCIYMFGGCNGTLDVHFNDLHMFNPKTEEWTELHPFGTPPTGRRRQSCVVVGDRAFIFGGSCPKPISQQIRLSPVPPELQIYVDAQCLNLDDLDDLHVLELEIPKLRTLCIMEVITGKLKTNMLPMDLQIDIKNMVTPNNVPDKIFI